MSSGGQIRAASYDYTSPGAAYKLKWTFHNKLGLVFVAVYQKILHLLYVDKLLVMVKHNFLQIYDPERKERKSMMILIRLSSS